MNKIFDNYLFLCISKKLLKQQQISNLSNVKDIAISVNPELIDGYVINYKKIGRIVYVNGYINSNTEGAAMFLVGINSSGCPLVERMFFTINAIGLSSTGEINNGQMIFNIPTGGKNLNFSFNFSYIAKE